MNPDPLLFSPDHAARQMALIGLDHQRETVGDADRGAHLERGAGFREIADRAIDCAAAKGNPALQQWAAAPANRAVVTTDARVLLSDCHGGGL